KIFILIIDYLIGTERFYQFYIFGVAYSGHYCSKMFEYLDGCRTYGSGSPVYHDLLTNPNLGSLDVAQRIMRSFCKRGSFLKGYIFRYGGNCFVFAGCEVLGVSTKSMIIVSKYPITFLKQGDIFSQF